ncbi:MAG: hypothetical protein CMI54_05660 [Parcubacteria group bacterium]|jgi:hypothetical protein|nr:hypothetical protein [Parcubacteria group bacterium]|tara:strand:+ start:12696 stop:12920 length:225 start_codon:yes stop_codon:yes gene_type:complete
MNKKIIQISRTTNPGTPEVVIERAVCIANDDAQALELADWRGRDNVRIDTLTVGESDLEPILLAKERVEFPTPA